MQRPDAHVFKSMQKAFADAKKFSIREQLPLDGWEHYFKYFGPEHLNHAASLPLVYLGKQDLESLNELKEANAEVNDVRKINWHEWIYEEFVLHYPALKDSGFFWSQVNVDKESDLVFFFGVMPTSGLVHPDVWNDYDVISCLPFHGWVKMANDDKNELVPQFFIDPNYVENVYGAALNKEEVVAETVKNHITTLLNDFLTVTHLLHSYIKEGDRHAVESTPKAPANPNSPANKGKPWRIKGPSLLLLDRMPSQQAQSTGTHASPKPHRRRGHWRTLSHPRYKNHPQYGSKIYVKPSFIGPRQEVYQGNVYRLIQDEIYEMDLPQSA